jgi:hypothetical protein
LVSLRAAPSPWISAVSPFQSNAVFLLSVSPIKFLVFWPRRGYPFKSAIERHFVTMPVDFREPQGPSSILIVMGPDGSGSEILVLGWVDWVLGFFFKFLKNFLK